MKIVIFGATGNIGRRVAVEALNRGHEVVGVVRDPEKVQNPDRRIVLVRGDATDVEGVSRAVRGADAIVTAISPRPSPLVCPRRLSLLRLGHSLPVREPQV
jgi:putative NADH-flavin reductase